MFLTQNLVLPLGYSCLTGTFHFAKNECSLRSRLTLSNLPPDDTETILLVGLFCTTLSVKLMELKLTACRVVSLTQLSVLLSNVNEKKKKKKTALLKQQVRVQTCAFLNNHHV